MNKIGLHTFGDSFEPTRLGRPRVVKLLEASADYKRRVREIVGPDCLIVARFYEAQQPLDYPEVRAREWWGRHANMMRAMTDPNTAFESYNEVGYDLASAAAYTRFEITRLDLMHRAGFQAIVGNWGVTWPTAELWPVYQPILDAMQPGDLLGLHEYWYTREGISDTRCCGRFPTHMPVVITECGRDLVFGLGAAGWQRTCGEEWYLEDLRLYEALLARHPNVVGACVFQAGANDPQWAAFDVAGIWDRVTAQYGATPPAAGGPPFRLGPLFDRWLWRVTTHHGDSSPTESGGTIPHKGVDFGCPEGTPIRAPYDAIVDVCATGSGSHADRGHYVWLLEERGLDAQEQVLCDTLYCHLRELPNLRSGDVVRRGQVFAHTGATGFATGPHLHFRISSVRNDPPDYTVLTDLDPEGPDVLRLEV